MGTSLVGRNRVKHLKIEGLFLEEAAPIDIEFKLTDRVTVLHGPNGSGKTIILELLDALRHGRYQKLWEMPFARFGLETAAGDLLEMYREPAAGLVGDLTVQVGSATGRITHYGPVGCALSDFLSKLPPIKLIGVDRLVSVQAISPAWVQLAQSLEAAGLEVSGARKATVDCISSDIRAEVSRANRAHLQLTVDLNATLAQRLALPSESLDVTELAAQRERIQAQEQRLRGLGLLSGAFCGEDQDAISPENAHIFATVQSDREQRLGVYRELVAKAYRIESSLRGTFRHKSLHIDATSGYHVASTSGQPLELTQLSLGEQHRLVMLHEMLFNVEPGTLLLIDEPERSLHPTWQIEILPEMLEIARRFKLDMVVATHSPCIVNDRTDLMVQVGGLAS